jgi:RNA polymerase sigma-70 factor, ECF subfamily
MKESINKQAEPGVLDELIHRMNAGDEVATGELVRLIYPSIISIARNRLRRELSTAQSDLSEEDLAQEVLLRTLLRNQQFQFNDEKHLFAVIGRQMRYVLVEYARSQQGRVSRSQVGIEEAWGLTFRTDISLIALDEALDKLEKINGRASRILELRFFVGMTLEESAECLGISVETAKRDWRMARSFLSQYLSV